MKTVLPMIRSLLIILLVRKASCQNGYSEQDILRYQQMAVNEAQTETGTVYNTNVGQRDGSNQFYNSANLQYHPADDTNKNDEYNRHDRARSRKVYRIKNPFQPTEENEKIEDPPQDIESGASNQYSAMQYSLPPEQFLAQMKLEGQYQQQFSTQSPLQAYTATPQPQFQYSTPTVSGYDSNQQSNYNPRSESRTYTPAYNNNFQYNNNLNSYSQDTVASTPIPTYLSTSLPNNQYLGTPASNYISSPSSIYLSSPQNIQQYISSPVSVDYTNRVTTAGSDAINYHNNELNKRMQIDHYDNSVNGIRLQNYPQNQYPSEYSSSTISPSVSTYYENKHDSWQNNINADLNSLSKSIQDNQALYNNIRYNTNQQDNTQETNLDNFNSDTHRIGSLPAANNVYLNYVKPDYQLLNNFKSRSRNPELETSSTEVYSHGDYGWKLSDKKTNFGPETSTTPNNFRYQIHSIQPDTGSFSRVNFQIETGKEYGYDATPKPSSEKLDPEEFARAAAKAHENYKQQLKANSYASNAQYNSNYFANGLYGSPYYLNTNKQKSIYDDNSGQNSNGISQSDLITASPYYYTSARETHDDKQKSPFDHDKALKNIVPIDVSNVVSHSDGLVRVNSGSDSINKFNILNYGKEHNDLTQQSTPSNDLVFYKDKNSFYSINLKPKPEDLLMGDRFKQLDQDVQYINKQQNLDSLYNYGGLSSSKRYIDDSTPRSANSIQQLIANQDNLISSANNPQSLHRPLQSDMSSFLKFNDIPRRLTDSFTADSLRLNNNNFDQNSIPSPLPLKLNQNVDNHNIDVASEFLNRLITNKAANFNRPDIDSQVGSSLSTINGFKVANPYNLDLKLVADMLKGKSAIDESQMSPFREQFTRPSMPMKLDVSALQQMLHLKNDNSPLTLSNGIGTLTSPYFDIFNGGRFPYQGVKYSRSEEEAENIPIADSSNNLPIGAVLDEDDTINISEETNITEPQEENTLSEPDPEKTKLIDSGSRVRNVNKHFHGPYHNRHIHKRKYPKNDAEEPYPLLKPPPPTTHQRGGYGRREKGRRRFNKRKILRVIKTEPLFEANSVDIQEFNDRLVEAKSDTVVEEGK